MQSDEMSSIGRNIQRIMELITLAHQKSCRTDPIPRLVAVSKMKSVEDILVAYRTGNQRHFGENYVDELKEKANDPQILSDCPELKWHFIGTVQSNKIPKIAAIPRLFMVETVTSEKSAKLFDRHFQPQSDGHRLAVMIQVNTSGEEQKGGVEPEESGRLADFIELNCAQLEFRGFMTIGSLESSRNDLLPNPDFQRLVDLRQSYCVQRAKPTESVELSMGMSSDFEVAVAMGSTNVRVGSTIFGSR